MAGSERIPLCVFAKPPIPGRAKTRLAAKIGDEGACRLATAFISDFLLLASSYDWAEPVLATTEDGMREDSFPSEAFPSQLRHEEIPRWLQPPGDLGAKIEGVVRKGLERAPFVVCCGADSPGRPRERLESVRREMDLGADIVLGPAEDGGYDILAMRTCPEGILAELPWSQPTTFAATKTRFEERGLTVSVLDTWWDVDEVEDLDRLHALLQEAHGAKRAPATAAVLASLALGGPT